VRCSVFMCAVPSVVVHGLDPCRRFVSASSWSNNIYADKVRNLFKLMSQSIHYVPY
jgi:hypothetical protein